MIKIKTALDEGIYKSDGGGQTRTHYQWKTGPHNLLKAIQKLSEHSSAMTQGYGSIGHNGSWIEIDETPIQPDEIANIDYDQDISKTQLCKNLIASIRDGSLIQDRINVKKSYDDYKTVKNNAYYEGINGKEFTGDQFNFSDYRDGQWAREAKENNY